MTLQMVRETFRALLSVPTLRDALAVTPAAPLFHSDYLLPLGERLRQRTGDAGKLLQVVRTLFQAQVAAYISPLCEFDPEVMKNHMRVWRSGPLAGLNSQSNILPIFLILIHVVSCFLKHLPRILWMRSGLARHRH